MPELIMERPKMSLQMHETLKKYILRERRKKKEEDVANEQKIREELVNFNWIWTFYSFSFQNFTPSTLRKKSKWTHKQLSKTKRNWSNSK